MTARPRIPAADPGAGVLAHAEAIRAALDRVMRSGWYVLGPEVQAFEAELARFVGVPHAVGVGSGTDALTLALRGLGMGPGQAVITVSHTAVATAAAIELAGAAVRFVDVLDDELTLDPDSLEAALRTWPDGAPRPRAVVPVHLYGRPARMDAIARVARQHGLFVVEDCAQAIGATSGARRVGALGDVAAFSFYPTKNLAALGDGGAVATADARLVERIRALRQYGWHERNLSLEPGLNSRLDELQAAVLRARLPHLEAENARRASLAAIYDQALRPLAPFVRVPPPAAAGEHVHHQYVVRAERRDDLARFLLGRGVGTLVHYPTPIHLQPAYRERVPTVVPLPVTERAAREVLSLPLRPELDEAAVHEVAAAVVAWAEGA